MNKEERAVVVQEAMEKYKPIQNAIELEMAMEVVQTIQPRVIVEIGTYRGGSLRCWSACAASDAIIVGTDTPGTPPEVEASLQSWLKPGQRGKIFLGDLTTEAFRDEILKWVGAPIDFLFIDGNHNWDYIERDYRFWAPSVRSGGMIGFHDIWEVNQPGLDSPRFWKELTAPGMLWGGVHAIFGSTDPTKAYGIGIVQKR